MYLSIITINFNNAVGLRKTLASVASQTYPHIEHIIVDGGSTDESVKIIREYADNQAKGERLEAKGTGDGKADSNNNSTPIYTNLHNSTPSTRIVRWISELDKGIYNAMNKGIRMATSEYCQFLNSGDMLAADDVTERMMAALKAQQAKGERLEVRSTENGGADIQASTPYSLHSTPTDASTPYTLHFTPTDASRLENHPTIFYGNMKKQLPNGKILHDACNGGDDVTLDMFYRGCLNHSPAYIKRSLFDKYGMYDETLRICSDWKFYMQSIVLGGEKVQYVDIDMTLFDMTGISETNKDLLNNERNQLLKEMVPVGILRDYDNYHFAVDQYKRLKKHHLWGFVYFIERVLFKLEKWHILR